MDEDIGVLGSIVLAAFWVGAFMYWRHWRKLKKAEKLPKSKLVKCRMCEKEVSPTASSCPHCGESKPAKITPKHYGGPKGCLLVVGAIVGIIVLMQLAAKHGAFSSASSDVVVNENDVKFNDPACKSNINCWADLNQLSAGFACQKPIESLANYDYEWTDGWLELKFSHFRWSDKGEYAIAYVGDKIKFQNGFGAWKKMLYVCDYLPGSQYSETGTVLDVRVGER